MKSSVAMEQRRPNKEPPLQRLKREFADFAASLVRLLWLSALFTPILLLSFLTLDLPYRAFDTLTALDPALHPSQWLTIGRMVMSAAPLFAVLLARRFGGEEASRVITASWTVAAIATFAEISYLAPALDSSDLPNVRFVMGFVASAMIGQYVAANIYDVIRGGGRWWRAPLYASLAGYGVEVFVYFPSVYGGANTPWINWMIGDFAVKTLIAFLFLPIYAVFRRMLKPRGGFGG